MSAYRLLGPATVLDGCPTGVAFLPADAGIVAAYADRRVRVMRLDGTVVASFATGRAMSGPIAVSPDGKRVVTSDTCIDLAKGKPLWTSMAPFLSVAFAPNGRGVFVGIPVGVGRVVAATGKLSRFQPQGTYWSLVTALSVSRDGRSLVAGQSNGNVVLVDLEKKKNRADEHSTLRRLNAVAFGVDVVAVAGDGPDVRLLSSTDLSIRRSLPVATPSETRPPHRSESDWNDSLAWPETRGLAWTPDLATLVTATIGPNGGVTRLQVWNADRGEERARLTFPGSIAHNGVAVSPNGGTIALAAATGVFVAEMPRIV